jgi:hypothetical protein
MINSNMINEYGSMFFESGEGSSSSVAPPPLLTVKIRQPSHEFTFGVGMNFIPYPLVLTPVV